MQKWNKNSEHLIYLISSAINGTDVKENRLDEIDFENLFILAQKHTVASMVCMELEKTEIFSQCNPNIRKCWSEAKYKAIRKSLMLEADFEILANKMENEGIWYLPLKGCVLKDFYPVYGMREMADFDILFDEAKRERVKELFMEQSYSVESYNISNHDVYYKPPVYNFEMHVSLFNDNYDKKLVDKYANVKDKLIQDKTKHCRFHFSNEDFYVYFIAHAYKHYSQGGTGVRMLADIYVINNKLASVMNWDYINRELRSLGIGGYEERSRLLSEKIFGFDKPLSEIAFSDDEREMLLYYLGSYTYGTMENHILNRLRSLQNNNETVSAYTKFKYCTERLFPGRYYFKNSHPFIYRNPYIIPFFWIWRIVAKIPFRMKDIKRELLILKSCNHTSSNGL